MKKLNKKGFTLVEMLVVIAIIAVLVAIIVPTVSSATTKAKAATDAANLRSALASATIKALDETSTTEKTYTYTELGVPQKAKSNSSDTFTCKVTFDNNGVPTVTVKYGEHDIAYYQSAAGTAS